MTQAAPTGEPGQQPAEARTERNPGSVIEIIKVDNRVSFGGAAIYRCFNASGQLLYVGVPMYPSVRFGAHAAESPWWPEVALIRVEWFSPRRDAELAERRAIQSEMPIHNIAQSPKHATQYGICAVCGRQKALKKSVITPRHAPCAGAGQPAVLVTGRVR